MTSWIDRTRIPALAIARIAESRPLPGPFTRTSTVRIPLATAARAADSPARWAANAVFLREPRNAMAPELLCATTLPSVSVKVISVLLNVAMMYARPCGTNLRSRLRLRDLGMMDSIPNQWLIRTFTAGLQPPMPTNEPSGQVLSSFLPLSDACRASCGRWSASAVPSLAIPCGAGCRGSTESR